jgi:hypothetical protein
MKSALVALAFKWRNEAALLRRYGCEQLAMLNEVHASDLERVVHTVDDEFLTQEAAASESGYSTRHLRNLTEQGTLPNHGRPGAPLYRRCELPRKPGHDPEAFAERAKQILQNMRLAS